MGTALLLPHLDQHLVYSLRLLALFFTLILQLPKFELVPTHRLTPTSYFLPMLFPLLDCYLDSALSTFYSASSD